MPFFFNFNCVNFNTNFLVWLVVLLLEVCGVLKPLHLLLHHQGAVALPVDTLPVRELILRLDRPHDIIPLHRSRGQLVRDMLNIHPNIHRIGEHLTGMVKKYYIF